MIRRSFKEYQHGYANFPGRLLDFSYILFDVVRYSEDDLLQAANVMSNVFYLEQTADPPDLAGRLRKLAGVLAGLTPEQFRQVTIWLKNVSGRKLPESMRAEVEQVLDETKHQEVNLMISNIERALDKGSRGTFFMLPYSAAWSRSPSPSPARPSTSTTTATA